MKGPPLGPGGEDITWPDQVAPQGRRTPSTQKHKPQTSNHNTHPQPPLAVPSPTIPPPGPKHQLGTPMHPPAHTPAPWQHARPRAPPPASTKGKPDYQTPHKAATTPPRQHQRPRSLPHHQPLHRPHLPPALPSSTAPRYSSASGVTETRRCCATATEAPQSPFERPPLSRRPPRAKASESSCATPCSTSADRSGPRSPAPTAKARPPQETASECPPPTRGGTLSDNRSRIG